MGAGHVVWSRHRPLSGGYRWVSAHDEFRIRAAARLNKLYEQAPGGILQPLSPRTCARGPVVHWSSRPIDCSSSFIAQASGQDSIHTVLHRAQGPNSAPRDGLLWAHRWARRSPGPLPDPHSARAWAARRARLFNRFAV